MRALLRFMPRRETLQRNRWLRWMGPALWNPRLWRISRRGLALGMALGVFFGLLTPIAQMPFSAAAAVALRANVPAAVASTLVSNPVTFGPVYYAAWRTGKALLGDAAQSEPPRMAAAEPGQSWWSVLRRYLRGVGKPLLLGLAVIASISALATYFLVSWIWVWRVRSRRRRRLVRAARRRGGISAT